MTASHAITRQRRIECRTPLRQARGLCIFQSLETGPSRLSKDWRIASGRDNAGRRRCGAASRDGQAMLESCIVVALMSLLLFGLMEVARLFMGREVLHYAASVGARAHAVGFNDFMIFKTVRVAAIPVAGKLAHPVVAAANPAVGEFQRRAKPGDQWDYAVSAHPGSTQYDQLEASRIPLYLGAERWGELGAILDYEDWDQQGLYSQSDGAYQVNTSVRQDVQLKFAFHRAFWGADEITEAGDVTMDGHYQLYLDESAPPSGP